jgi:hypothetical protein
VAKHLAKIDVPQYLHGKRTRKLEKREKRFWKAHIRNLAHNKALSENFGKQSTIVKMMANGFPPDKKLIRKGRITFSIPPSFSIIDSPEQTLASLSLLAQQMQAERLGQVFLDFRKLTKYDLGANGLLDVLVDELSIQARQTKRKIRWRGTYPADSGDRRFVKAMGVIKRLKIEHEYPSKDEEDKLALFDTRCKHYVRALKPKEADLKARVTQRFADHINKCLGSVKMILTNEARGRLCQYVGEIIDNAEEHAGMLDWAIQGYLDTHLEVPMCEIVIFNFGRTIAESFASLPEDSYTRRQIKTYIDLHQKNGFFQHKWRIEDLHTLIALQGNVSSKNKAPTDTRGNGTVDLIEFFQRVQAECSNGQRSDEQARMAIVSGSTYILFDGKYKMQENSNGIRIIAFNDANDLRQKPDPQYVRQLEGVEFPGTLISIKFPLSTSVDTVATGETP